MLDRGEVGWSRIPVPMSDAACEFIPKLGEQRIELGGALTADGQEVGSRDYSSSIVANSRSSLYRRNMVELVVG